MILRWLLFIGCILLVLGTIPASAKKSDGPEIKATKFDSKPKNLFYFEDTDTIVFQDSAANDAYISHDAGEKWEAIDADKGMSGHVLTIWPHPYDKETAYILGAKGTHWITKDAGKNWKSVEIPTLPSAIRPPLAFHGRDSDKVIFHGEICEGFDCSEETYYTTDGFRTVNRLSDQNRGCSWAVGHPSFAEDSGKNVEDRVFCVVRGQHSSSPKDFRLLYSDKYFQGGSESEPGLDGGRPIKGVINAAAVKKFLIVAAKAEGTDELALYVSGDAVEWHRAEFGGHRLEEEAYTVLESTNYSIQVDALTSKKSSAMGALFTSNSNGTYFTRNIEHTNRDLRGTVDFEKMTGIQGIVLVNTVNNWEEVEKTSADKKKIVSKISFDDGRTFQSLKVDDKDLHLHSVTSYANSGRVFSSPAPGLVMGVGNTGNHLKDYQDGDLYVSDDAGLTWRRGLKDAHKYEFGDQGAVIMAINDEGRTNEISYSINHGKDWETAKLPHKIRADLLTTTPDSTSLKFLLVGSAKGDLDHEHYVMSIDFSDLHERKCKDSDFESWPARLNEKNEPDCLMGHKQFYRRRKANADCFVDQEFKDPVPEFKQCKCSKEDFECDYNFVRSDNGTECVPASLVAVPDGACDKPEDTYKGSSGFRLIPGNECSGGERLDKEEVERSCSDTLKHKNPANGEISTEKSFFPASRFKEYYYLERKGSDRGNDETVIMRTDQSIYVSADHGKSWKEVLKDKGVIAIFPHPHLSNTAYFLTGTKKAFWTVDRAETFHGFEAPLPPSRDSKTLPLAFHFDNKELMIWSGASECDFFSGDCHAVAYYTTNRGDSWDLLLRYVRKCEFIKREGRDTNDKLIFCEQYENENLHNPRQLVGSDNWFVDKTVHFDNIEAFATMSEFIIVAAHSEKDNSLKLDASVDGETFADAEFPPNFHVPIQQAYTVLDSSTHSVTLHVTVNNVEDHEYGTILRSNSNGTSYVVSLNAVNRNTAGYVDFEKTQGLEGIAIVNVVGNVEESDKGKMKRLKTMITHNDGAQWSLLPPPKKDIDGNGFGCSTDGDKPTDKCSLHLHGYTERKDPRDTFSSPSAIGVMLGVGNVGEYLSIKDEGNTFMTRDGGITWKMVKKGSYMWEYGDQGSIIVIIEESTPTKVLYYSLDEGDTWEEYKFSDIDMQIDDISTVPSDTSRNFLLWGKEVGSGGKKGIATVNLDFTGLRERQCKWDKDISKTDDYYLWEPKHPMQDQNCLFGHISQYYRKKPEADCYNGGAINEYNITQNCDCTRQDYECDYNYEPQNDGSCALVPGLEPADPKKICYDDPDAIEYYAPTGYRLIPLSTCTNGLQLNHFEAFPCPDKEKEFEEKHPKLSGAGLFFAIVIPIGLAGAIGYYIYTRWGRDFGRIQLGDGSFGRGGLSGGSWLSKDSPLVTVPVMVVAGAFAVASALPLLAMSLWRSVRGYIRIPSSGGRGGRGSQRPYASRGAFAARRGDYVGVVNEDEDELLGGDDFSDDDDEV